MAELIWLAAHARCIDGEDAAQLAGRLARADFGEDGRILVAVELERAICDHAAVQLKSGWHSVDLWEATRRQGGAGDCALLAGLLPAAIARAGDIFRADHLATKTQRRLDPAGSGWERDVSLAIRLIETLAHLPVLNDLRAIGASLHRGADPKQAAVLLSKIRALLAKAESTDFDDEADAYTAKASELMARTGSTGRRSR